MKLPPSPSAAAQNCIGPVSACLDGPQSDVLALRVYLMTGRELAEVRVSIELVDPGLLIASLQRPRIGFN